MEAIDAIVLIETIVGVVTLGWTVVSFILTRGRLSRFERSTLDSQLRAEHHGQLIAWIQLFLSDDRQSQELSVKMLRLLAGATWATDEDRVKVAEVLNVIEGDKFA